MVWETKLGGTRGIGRALDSVSVGPNVLAIFLDYFSTFHFWEPGLRSLLPSVLSGKLPRFATELWQQSGCLSVCAKKPCRPPGKPVPCQRLACCWFGKRWCKLVKPSRRAAKLVGEKKGLLGGQDGPGVKKIAFWSVLEAMRLTIFEEVSDDSR
jgi:hypothetical protein